MRLFILIFILLNYIGCINTQKKITDLNKNIYKCYNQNDEVLSLGEGIAIWNYECDSNLNVFGDSLLSILIFDLNICKKNNSDICPLFYKPDYGIFHFIVLEVSSSWIKILYNKNKIGYLSTDSIFNYVSWHNFLLDYTTGIIEKGNDSVYIIQTEKNNYLTAINKKSKQLKKIQWRKNNKLLIDILLL